MHYISVALYRKVVEHALIEGLSSDDFKELETPISLIPEINAVPADHFFSLHETIEKKLGPGFAVRVGQQMKIQDYGVLGLSWKTCSWAGEIFDRSERYFRLLSDTYIFKVDKGIDISRVFLYRDAYRRGVALSNEATFSATVVVLQAITKTDITPYEVSFKHKAPIDLIDHNRAFKCPVIFDQSENFISYKTTDLETRSATADISINKFLLERVKEETEGIEISANKIAIDTEALIKDALPSGIPAIGDIGHIMGMSSRTLARRLSASGRTYRDLIVKVQLEVSMDLLRNSLRSLAEIAYETGFSEQSAFNRAFKRWTGQSPLEFRKKS